MTKRHYSTSDLFIMELSQALETTFGKPRTTQRSNPAMHVAEAELSAEQKSDVSQLMRINHVGEVCAQALYQSQALTSRNARTRAAMKQSANEENDHLAWCAQRLDELGGRKSLLNPLWYTCSFCIGAVAGMAGDKWNLGFVAETEQQVVQHLETHLQKLPEEDARSRAVLEQMRSDEAEHAEQAIAHGGAELPQPVQRAMRAMSKVMTATARYV